jgi:transposase
MAKSYSLDLRERIMKDYDAGVPVEDLTVHYEVSRSWLYSLIKQRKETGTIAPRTYRPGRKQKLAPYEQEVRQVVADHPDGTLEEFCEKLSKYVLVSTTTLCDFLHRLKITRKKNSLRRRTTSSRCCLPSSGVGETLCVD